MNKDIIIAIDGYSACGKSTTAKEVALQLNYIYIDTGAMYRAVTLFFIENNIALKNQAKVLESLNSLEIYFQKSSPEADSKVFLNGKSVADKIRTPEVNARVSEVSAISAVRKKLVTQQKAMGESKGLVMDGRDIGTVVFPNAELKIFMLADIDVRVERRKIDLLQKNIEMSEEKIRENLLKRDKIDSSRKDSPLRKADDAVLIDTTHIEFEAQVEQIVSLAKNKMEVLASTEK